MEFKRPDTFEDILNLQKHLDENLNNVRKRTLEDIKLSLIAECIEFNEETKDSHKTWKTKPYNKQNELEELMVEYGCDVFNNSENYLKPNSVKITGIIIEFLGGYNNIALGLYLSLVNKYGYTKEDILNCYWEKWQKNMNRIGKEWN